MLKSICLIFLFLLLGEGLSYLFNLPIAGNILGMILIFLALRSGLISLESAKPAADKLLKYMVLFFVPYGVGLMVYFDVVIEHWLAIGLTVIVSTAITLLVTGYAQQKLEK